MNSFQLMWVPQHSKGQVPALKKHQRIPKDKEHPIEYMVVDI